MSFYDFEAIKKDVSIEEAAKMVGLNITNGRCQCPSCETDNTRSLSISADKNAFYCFHAKKGGDVLSFVSHCLGITVKAAAEMLVDHVVDRPPVAENATPEKEEPVALVALNTLQRLPVLEPNCEEVRSIGLDTSVAAVIGAGYSKSGLMRGHIAVPVFAEGNIIGYIGIPKGTKVKLPKNLEVHHDAQ